MKQHGRTNEELKFECERLTLQLQKVNHEKEETLEMRKEDCGAMEALQQKNERQARVINKICRDINKVQELVNSISKEFQLNLRIQPESAVPT